MPSSSAAQQFSSVAKSYMQTQEQLMPVEQKRGGLYIGIPRETSLQENRVALVPSSVYTLVARGHRVVIETGAGEQSHFSDHEYSEAGAEIAHTSEQVYQADIILKVAPPTLTEIEYFHPGQILISPLQEPTISEEYVNKLRHKRVIALAMEYIKDEVGTYPIVRIMSEIAGMNAMLTASELLNNTRGGIGVLLGGVSGVPPAKVVILGAGVVAEFATRVALGLGAEVRIFDNTIYKIMRLQNRIGRQLYTSSIDPSVLEQELKTADAVIGAIHAGNGRTPIVVTEDMVMKMKAGSVMIDVSIDQGGCFETSRLTTHDKPTFKFNDVIHYCVPNIASRVPRTASAAISNILTPLLLKGEQTGGFYNLLTSNAGLMHGIYIFKGTLTNHYLSERFKMRYTNIELLITAAI
jgi:alanine dehydrogenase